MRRKISNQYHMCVKGVVTTLQACLTIYNSRNHLNYPCENRILHQSARDMNASIRTSNIRLIGEESRETFSEDHSSVTEENLT